MKKKKAAPLDLEDMKAFFEAARNVSFQSGKLETLKAVEDAAVVAKKEAEDLLKKAETQLAEDLLRLQGKIDAAKKSKK